MRAVVVRVTAVPSISRADVEAWLRAFAGCVREGDYDGGRALFAADAAGFGTVSNRYSGLDELHATQWAQVWERTEGFEFDEVDARWSTPDLCVVAATWSSRRVGAAVPAVRTGRVTLVLRADRDGTLRAVHSHFSMSPGTRA